MCTALEKLKEDGKMEGLQEGRQEGLQEGKRESLISSIRNLMESMDWTADQAMNALKISEEEQEKYRMLLKK